MKPAIIKTSGYLVSTLSVLLLAFVSWKSARENIWLMTALFAGAASSIVGMLLRWLSYQIEERQEGKIRPPSRANHE